MITPADIKFYQSQGVDSSGGAISGIQIDKAKISRIFPATSRDGIADGEVTYRKVFVRNTAAQPFLGVGVYLLAQPANLERIAFALGTDDDTDPTGLVFEEPAGRNAAFGLGEISADQAVPLWIRRTTPEDTPEFEQAMFQLVVEGYAQP